MENELKEAAAPNQPEIYGKKLSKALTWTELANEYDKLHHGRKAITLEMDYVWDWAENKKEIFRVSEDGTIHKIV